MSFPQYPKYQNSGFEWIGPIPCDWQIKRLKNEAFVIMGQSPSSDSYNSEGVGTPFLQGNADFGYINPTPRSYSTEANKFAERGDLLLSVRAPVGAINIADQKYGIGRGLCAIRAKEGITQKFLYYSLELMKSELFSIATGSTYEAVTVEQVNNSVCLVPPLMEQKAISNFLDIETSKIDRLISEQEKVIDLLKTKFQSLVLNSFGAHDTVMMRLVHAVDVIQRPVTQQAGVLYEPLGLYNRGRGLFHKELRGMDEMGDSDFYWINSGDLILSGQFAWEGSVAMAYETEENCVVSHRYPVIRGKAGVVLTEYLFALFTTSHGDFLLNECSVGAAGRNRPLNMNLLLKEIIPIPNILTQERIVEMVHQRRNLLQDVTKQRNLLLEHRNSLIKLAVTGQIDVRNVAAETEAA
jgi:type I restriction enzyme S subunit